MKLFFFATIFIGLATSAVRSQVAHLQGEMAGEVTDTSIILQSRLTAPKLSPNGDVPGRDGVARFELADNTEFINSRKSPWLTAIAAQDFIVKVQINNLNPGTLYYYRLWFGSDLESITHEAVRSFKTLPGANSTKPVHFVVVTGMNYARFHTPNKVPAQNKLAQGLSKDEKMLGYPALASILKLEPDFFVSTGDSIYYDHPHNTAAHTLPELRKKWHEQFVQPRYVDLFGRVATYWEKDDHDHRFNDCDRTGDRLPSSDLGIATFREQVPVTNPEQADAVTYRTHRVSRDLQIWLLEGRDYRSPNKAPDGPEKTIWGKKQKEWLQRTLLESEAAFKIIISPTPMVGPDDAYKKDNHTNPQGFLHEGRAFFSWLKKNGLMKKGLYLVCGDRHWQYHSIHPSGVEEFSCGALVDANARIGRSPGDPKSTDPDALIQQPYTQDSPSGGFLQVGVKADPDGTKAYCQFRFYDEKGVLLHETQKTRKVQ